MLTRILLYILVGILGIFNMVIWGIYGDLLVEVFDLKKVLRSLIIAMVYSVFLFFLNPRLPLIIVLLNVIAFERVTTEIYKACIRKESQDKYLIPSDLNISIPLPMRRVIGFLLLASLILIFKYFSFEFNRIFILLLAGFIPAFGGMSKDAPYEGFEPLKFFRSPSICLAIGIPLFNFFPVLGLKYFLFSLWGGERIIGECYKKIINGNIPGKFKVDIYHPINQAWKRKRKILLIPYWGSLLLIFIVTYLSLT